MAGILNSPALIEETRNALPALHRVATAKAGREGVKAVIGRRFALYQQPARSDGEWAAWWADYFDVLEDVSLASLEAAMRAHVADPASEFMPKPGRLRELAFITPCRSLLRYQRAKRALDVLAAPAAPPQGPKPEASAVRAMLEAYKAQNASRRSVTAPQLPSTAGKPDETGITPQMRELLAKQAAP